MWSRFWRALRGPDKPASADHTALDVFLLDDSKWPIVLATAGWLLWSRSAHIVVFVLGALCSAALARLLKRIIAQPRPEAASWKPTQGMPSSHSTNLTYFAASIALAAAPPPLAKGAALAVLALLLSWRVKHDYHTGKTRNAASFYGKKSGPPLIPPRARV